MAIKHQRTTSKRGRRSVAPNPQRIDGVMPNIESRITPIGKAAAMRLANGVPIPTMKGVSIRTPDGRNLVKREIKKGAVNYHYAILG